MPTLGYLLTVLQKSESLQLRTGCVIALAVVPQVATCDIERAIIEIETEWNTICSEYKFSWTLIEFKIEKIRQIWNDCPKFTPWVHGNKRFMLIILVSYPEIAILGYSFLVDFSVYQEISLTKASVLLQLATVVARM